ncbi:MAG TPA: NUDIX domain-containing protein [Microbacteriaceae bacterium]|nr:NUDIX domain-containing protein [Microbacteriaceae bacterium]
MPDIHVSAALILDASSRLLVVRKHGTRGFMQPGGKPEPGESAAETLARELAEEVGIDAPVSALHPLGTFRSPAANERGFTVVADVFELGDVDSVRVGAEIAEARWLSRTDAESLGENLAPLIREHFLDRLG